jgi:hypothetical protein
LTFGLSLLVPFACPLFVIPQEFVVVGFFPAGYSDLALKAQRQSYGNTSVFSPALS